MLPGGHWVAPGGPRVLPGGYLVVTGRKMKVLESLGNGVFGPLAPRGGFGGDPPLHSRLHPAPWCQERVRKVLWNDDLAPCSSDKIRAKILDLGYGGARRVP